MVRTVQDGTRPESIVSEHWHKLANSTASAIAEFAPVTAGELSGAASALSHSPLVVSLLAVEYESLMWKQARPLRCATDVM